MHAKLPESAAIERVESNGSWMWRALRKSSHATACSTAEACAYLAPRLTCQPMSNGTATAMASTLAKSATSSD